LEIKFTLQILGRSKNARKEMIVLGEGERKQGRRKEICKTLEKKGEVR
jgi:hypothetical protein